MREPSWPSTSSGTSVGDCVTKKTPTPLERISRTVWAIWSRKASEASLKSRCASSKKKTSLGLSRSPSSGRSWKRSASSHIRNVEKSAGRSWRLGSSSRLMMPRPSSAVRRNSLVSNSGSPKNTSAPWASKATSSRRITPAVCGERPPMRLELGLPGRVAGEVLQDRAQVGEVEQRQPLLVAVVEDQAQRGLLRLVQAEHLGEQRRAERAHRHADGYADALAADRVELRREAGRRPRPGRRWRCARTACRSAPPAR